MLGNGRCNNKMCFLESLKYLILQAPECMCVRKYFLGLFCIMQQITLDDGAVKMSGGGGGR